MLFVRVLRHLTVLGAALLWLGAVASAQVASLVVPGAAPDLQGDNSTYDDATKQVVVKGNARLAYGNIYLTADEIHFMTRRDILSDNADLINEAAEVLVNS